MRKVRSYRSCGTVVHTTAGTETTFQRLAAGDLLKLLIVTSEDGEEVIIEIWMQ